jgi:serine protease AprX
LNTRISGDNFLNTRNVSQLNRRKDIPSTSLPSAPVSNDKFDFNLENYLDAQGFKVNEDGLSPVIIEGKEPEEVAKKKEEIIAQGGHIDADLPIIGGFSAEIPPKEILKIARKGTLAIIPDGDMHAYLDVASSVVGATAINNKGFTGKGVTVAVIDTGIAPHKDLSDQKTGQSRIIGFKDFVNGKTEPYDDNGHGSHCAGDVGANGASSSGKNVGPAPDASLVGVKVLSGSGSGSFSNIIQGIQWVVENKDKFNPPIKVVSMSLGGTATRPSDDDPVCQAVEAAKNKGLVVLIAAGNSGPTEKTIGSPGIEPSIITIGAFDDRGTVDRKDDKIAYFSSRGPTIDNEVKPDLVSPGYNITSLKPGGGYTTMSGTSMATPVAAGLVAAILEANPSLTPDGIKEILMSTAENRGLDPNIQGAGYIDGEKAIAKALKMAQNGGF